MSLDQFSLQKVLLKVVIIGKSSQTTAHKTSLKLEFPQIIFSILTLHFVIMCLDLLFMD